MCGLCKSIEIKSFIEYEKLHGVKSKKKEKQRLIISCVFAGMEARVCGLGFGKESTGTGIKGAGQRCKIHVRESPGKP